MNKQDMVHDLVYTRINGNSIMGYPTYRTMLNRVTKEDIKDYASTWCYELYSGLYGTKLEMIEQIKNHITRS